MVLFDMLSLKNSSTYLKNAAHYGTGTLPANSCTPTISIQELTDYCKITFLVQHVSDICGIWRPTHYHTTRVKICPRL